MPAFLRLLPPDQARERLFANLGPLQVRADKIQTASGLGRVTGETVVAPHPLPEFRRSSVDGFALRAADTRGASDSLPAYLRLVGEIAMGAAAPFDISRGECALIHTGGMLPPSADAVVMLEQTQRVDAESAAESPAGALSEIEVLKAVADGENIINIGEDVARGQIVLRAGTRLRPAEIGGLMALGITELRVARKPRVGLISSGDEVVTPTVAPLPGQVRDVNAPALAALIAEAGGAPVPYGVVPDRLELLMDMAAGALTECDMLIISGGSSASARDTTAAVIDVLGKPGVLVHGIHTRPGKPTILGVCDGKAVVGLPGNPVSALVIARHFVVPVIEHMLGIAGDVPRPTVNARLTVNLASEAGREDWWPVRLTRPGGADTQWVAEPIHGKSNLIFSLAAANGLVRIPVDANGLSSGEVVEVELL